MIDFDFVPLTVMPYNSAHHCVVEVENFLLLLGGEDQWNPNGTDAHTHACSSHARKKKGKHSCPESYNTQSSVYV